MGIFETVKNGVSLRDAAERYVVTKQGRRMVCCPFHPDKHPSLLLADDHFHCFGCGAHGDVIDFTAQLFGLRPYDAVRKLAADFGIDPDLPPAISLRKPTPGKAQPDRTASMQAYVRKLEDWKIRYAPKQPGEILDIRFIEACRNLDTARHYLEVLQGGEDVAWARKEAA